MGNIDRQGADGQRRPSSASTEASSHYHRGLLHENGWQGAAQSMEEAVQWFIKAADLGHTGAQYALGWAYAEGRGVAKNDKEAMRWWRRAAEAGHADAMYRLASLYMESGSALHDTAEAQKWLAKAAELDAAKPDLPLQVTGNGATYVDPAALLDCPKVCNQLDVFRHALRAIPGREPA